MSFKYTTNTIALRYIKCLEETTTTQTKERYMKQAKHNLNDELIKKIKLSYNFLLTHLKYT